ncbi:STAS domain-containing protein [Desulfotruncus alcoholivorax]|uniref:STAS domain-containing protein n=1 Tax=Desulfotruncus alcoholivorax TaxID=265477 RepID=UPI0003FC6AA5|nr:STAS domain-containing protein [Desulfotruncus alcoholivorax]
MKKKLNSQTEWEEEMLFLRLSGDITSEGEEEFKKMLPLDEPSAPVVLDFAGVDYINSAGLALLIGLVRRCRESGRPVGAINLSGHYRKIFHMVGLNDYITVFDSEDAARLVFASENNHESGV